MTKKLIYLGGIALISATPLAIIVSCGPTTVSETTSQVASETDIKTAEATYFLALAQVQPTSTSTHNDIRWNAEIAVPKLFADNYEPIKFSLMNFKDSSEAFASDDSGWSTRRPFRTEEMPTDRRLWTKTVRKGQEGNPTIADITEISNIQKIKTLVDALQNFYTLTRGVSLTGSAENPTLTYSALSPAKDFVTPTFSIEAQKNLSEADFIAYLKQNASRITVGAVRDTMLRWIPKNDSTRIDGWGGTFAVRFTIG